MARVLALTLALALVGGAPARAVEAVWIGPEVGAWNVGANWSTGIIPSFSTAVRIDDNPGQNTRVESRTTVTSGQLIVIDAGDTLAVINSQFTVGRILSLEGTISVEGSGQFAISLLTLSPGGSLGLAGTNATATVSSQFFNEGEIHGGGRLTISTPSSNPVPSYNASTIRADNTTIPLTLQLSNSVNFENHGRLIATGGGRLQIHRGFAPTPIGVIGGRIEAHAGSTVSLGSVQQSVMYVEGAVLAMIEDEDPQTAAPKFEFYGAELKNITLEGNFRFTGATFSGSITNPGEITTGTFRTSPNWHNDLKGEVWLTGGGIVHLPGSSQALFGGGTGVNDRLINVNNVIRGRGELLTSWTGFTNRHVVEAEPNGELVFYNGLSNALLINSGVMKAVNGGRLRLGHGGGSLGTMENFEGGDAGEIVATENSTVILANIHIKGGQLRAEGENPATRGKYIADQLVVLEKVKTVGDFRFENSAGQLGTVTFNKTVYNTGSMTGRFAVSTSAELAGGGEVVGEGGILFSFSSANASFVNVDNLIRGGGNINGTGNNRFANRGTIRSDGSITFHAQLPVVNRGRIEAGPGAQVTMPTIPVVLNYEDGTPGVIHAADGGIVNITRVDGGVLSTEGTGLIHGSGGFIKDIHNLGTLEVNFVTPQGIIVNDGIIRGTLNVSSTFARLNGAGTWETPGSSLTGGLFINGPQHTILGIGSFGSGPNPQTVFVNEGTLRAREGLPFNIRTFAFQNSGLVHTPTDRTMSITSSVGRVENKTGTIQVEGNLSVAAPAGLYNQQGGTIDVHGSLTLENTVLMNRSAGSITGSGSILRSTSMTTAVVNEGRIAPGAGLATLSIHGNYVQLASGVLDMEIVAGDEPASDLLAIDGTADLAGSLTVTLTGTDPLAIGDSFTLLTATEGIVGGFDQLMMPSLEEELFWYLEYAGTDVRATVAEVIPGDFNRDGHVTAADFVAWRKAGDSQIDYEQWRANYGRSISSNASSPAAAPEPNGIFLLLLGLAALSSGRLGRAVPPAPRPARLPQAGVRVSWLSIGTLVYSVPAA